MQGTSPAIDAEDDWTASQLATTKSGGPISLADSTIELPRSASRFAESIRANLAYILINHDGAGIQPGSRSYERSWIRDGSLTSTALLRLGHPEEVRDFINWYARYPVRERKDSLLRRCARRRSRSRERQPRRVHLSSSPSTTGTRATAALLEKHVAARHRARSRTWTRCAARA